MNAWRGMAWRMPMTRAVAGLVFVFDFVRFNGLGEQTRRPVT